LTTVGIALAGAAEKLIGCPFKLHGRNSGTGIDCVGVVTTSLKAIGRPSVSPSNYSLRNLSFDPFLPAIHEAGLVDVADMVCAGDVLLVRPSPAQFHLGIVSLSGTLVHAHSGLRRVVSTPFPLSWPIERHWRLLEF